MARIGLVFSAAKKLLLSQAIPHYVAVQHTVKCNRGLAVLPER